ncbi:hypothetical protein [Maribacter sp. R86514]|uniref:hypothetical protein n=1 Tax=Maribacter sp. R86514 TaxID=3093854 RepID=UPI0037CC8493
MEWPTRNELSICTCYQIIGAGWAYWNSESKMIYEFDINGNLIGNDKSEKCPSNLYTQLGRVFLKSMSGVNMSFPKKDVLDIENVYDNTTHEILNNEIAYSIRQKLHVGNKTGKSLPIKNKIMNETYLKLNDQALYNEIFNLGVTSGITAERKRVNSWLESGIKNKWQIRDGIKSGKSFADFHQSEINNFYGVVDEKIDSKFNFTNGQQKNIVENKEPDHYQRLEAKDFYDEVDSLLRR